MSIEREIWLEAQYRILLDDTEPDRVVRYLIEKKGDRVVARHAYTVRNQPRLYKKIINRTTSKRWVKMPKRCAELMKVAAFPDREIGKGDFLTSAAGDINETDTHYVKIGGKWVEI